MQIEEAVNLINHKNLKSDKPQIWCDLGCGAGTFTLALAEILAAESLIYAIDKNFSSLTRIHETYKNVNIEKINRDFVQNAFDLPESDGILMANSLHFVEDKVVFLRRAAKTAKRFLIVEYENRQPNQWVPFPIDFQSLKKLFNSLGFSTIEKINRRKSAFGGEMYAALIF